MPAAQRFVPFSTNEISHPARGLFSWAIKTGKLPADRVNPMGTVEQPQKNKSRERVLTNEEIALIWKACEDWEAEVLRDDEDHAKTGKRHKAGVRSITDFSRVVRLLFVTGMRPQEIGDLQWAEVDLDNGEICIPETRMKTKEELANPLSDMAVKILRGVAVRPDKACVFGQGNKSGTGLDTNGVNNKINRRIERAGGVPPKNWTPHDIRRTFRTRLSEIGVQNDVAEALLGHAIGNKIKRTYDRYHHWPEKRAALARWEDKLRAIIAGTAEKVVAPRFGQRRSAS
jgi:integrase